MMKCTAKRLAALILVLLCALLLAACGEQETTVTVTLVNRSGHGITSVCITPSTETDWGENYVDELLGDGESVLAVLGTYKESETPDTWNILVYGEEDYILYDTNVDELDFQLSDGDCIVFLPPEGDVPIEITSSYDPADYDELSYVEEEVIEQPEEPVDLGDLSAYVGCWKYDEQPFYLVIGEDYEWVAINLYGERINPGQVVVQENDIALYMEDGSYFTALNETAYGGLSDENGNALSAWDYIMLLPTPDDELNQTASFPGGFPNVTINYPIQMEAHEHPSVSNALSFNAVMEEGTEDYYSNIMIAFQPISGYDDYMTQGAAVAKPYMKHMLDGLLSSMYGNKVLKSFGSNFKNNGDHYSMTGYLWLDGSIFADGPNQPVRGCIEVRYYGPTGYALVAVTIAVEGRIRNYFDICNNMLETISYTAGWSTAPKAVPSQPASQGSDPGDYGSPYYWYDEDGDVWYWNGYENEFISYGSDGYIDDDTGEYMEANDAGWDPGEEDYYDDYNPWSDPGDGWDDYAYDDEGWGDYFD